MTRANVVPYENRYLANVMNIITSLTWRADVVDLSTERESYLRMPKAVQDFFGPLFAFFAVVDTLILRNYSKLVAEVESQELSHCLIRIAAQESVHSEAYGLLVQAVLGEEAASTLLDPLSKYECVQKAAQLIDRYIDTLNGLGERFMAFALVEGVMFCWAFSAIAKLRQYPNSPLVGAVTFNDWISRDENLHSDLGCYVVRNMAEPRPTQERAHELAREVYEATMDFFAADRSPFPCPDEFITNSDLVEHVQYITNQVLSKAGYAPLFEDVIETPLKSLAEIVKGVSGQKVNFFESKSTKYMGQPGSMAAGSPAPLPGIFTVSRSEVH